VVLDRALVLEEEKKENPPVKIPSRMKKIETDETTKEEEFKTHDPYGTYPPDTKNERSSYGYPPGPLKEASEDVKNRMRGCISLKDRYENQGSVKPDGDLSYPDSSGYQPGTSYATHNFTDQQALTNEKDKNKSKLTLSFLLNLFDGVLETPGRILIMTSNYPERLDKALIRPGRVDINLHLGYCDDSLVHQMYKGFYGKERDFTGIENKKCTPAKIQEVLCNNFNNPEEAYRLITS